MKAKDPQNESALVCAARDGDKDALQTLLTRHWSWLKALVYGVLGDARDLDDVMQEVCLRVIARIHTLREPECFRSWLAVLARREALKRRQRRTPRPVEIDPESEAFQMAGPVESPLEELEREELYGRILEAVETLPQIYREVFLLAHGSDLTYAQMAEVLDVPVTTMQIRLVRARRMIQKQVIGNTEHKVHRR
ncbi:MAG: RNA polymerase sigma factor [Sedimentisphaerales bacterium]|nr:RNA polymerase sigma factor [Sedimentisphaerales bacterium]